MSFNTKQPFKRFLTGLLVVLMCVGVEHAYAHDHSNTTVKWQEQTIVLEHSVEDIEKVALECWNYDKLFPYVGKSLRLAKDQCYVETQIKWKGIDFGTFWMKIRVHRDTTKQNESVVAFVAERTAGNVKHFEAAGELIRVSDTTTKAVVRIKADPGMPGVPDSVIEDNIKTTLKKFMKNLTKRLDEGSYQNSAFFN